MQETKLRTFKVVLLGPCQVGKTNIIRRFTWNTFSEDLDSTIGVSSLPKSVDLDGTSVVLDLWDTAGQEKYQCLLPMYARGSAAIICVFDLSKAETLDAVIEWIQTNRDEYPNSLFFLVGNKNDLVRDENVAKAENWAAVRGIDYLETSAKTGSNIENLFITVAGAVSTSSLFLPNNENTLVEERTKSRCC